MIKAMDPNKLNFPITSSFPFSHAFRTYHIDDFKEACAYIARLPYGRNKDKSNLLKVFADQCGTCSTKHALLKSLADENGFKNLKLIAGIFKMNRENTPKISPVLEKYQLDYIPEAHCYLRYNNMILDYTKADSDPATFMDEIMEETEIMPDQITAYKVDYHKNYLKEWLIRTPHILYTLDEVWAIREKCIEIF